MSRKGDIEYRITILNWDKYQREMRGGENRKRRREWIAISTGLLHDPNFFRLTIEQRYLWLMLVCYAGAVGPVFELSASDARVLFKLRRSADFESLRNQGFITFEAATIQDKTRQTIQDNTIQQKVASLPKVTPKKDERFEDFWKVWPVKKAKAPAQKKWASMKLDNLADEIIKNVTYRVAHDIQWRDPQFIPHPTTFLNQRRWEDEMIQTAKFEERLETSEERIARTTRMVEEMEARDRKQKLEREAKQAGPDATVARVAREFGEVEAGRGSGGLRRIIPRSDN